MTKRVKIGEVGIDSGTLILIDPCYIKHTPLLHHDDKWRDFCENVLFPMHDEKISATEYNLGVVFSNRIGDGSFPVYAHLDKNNAIKKIEVVF